MKIFLFIQKYLTNDSNVAQLFHKAKLSIHLTGGTANLVGIEQLAQNIFRLEYPSKPQKISQI